MHCPQDNQALCPKEIADKLRGVPRSNSCAQAYQSTAHMCQMPLQSCRCSLNYAALLWHSHKTPHQRSIPMFLDQMCSARLAKSRCLSVQKLGSCRWWQRNLERQQVVHPCTEYSVHKTGLGADCTSVRGFRKTTWAIVALITLPTPPCKINL